LENVLNLDPKYGAIPGRGFQCAVNAIYHFTVVPAAEGPAEETNVAVRALLAIQVLARGWRFWYHARDLFAIDGEMGTKTEDARPCMALSDVWRFDSFFAFEYGAWMGLMAERTSEFTKPSDISWLDFRKLDVSIESESGPEVCPFVPGGILSLCGGEEAAAYQPESHDFDYRQIS
jgi:hypothetical protein